MTTPTPPMETPTQKTPEEIRNEQALARAAQRDASLTPADRAGLRALVLNTLTALREGYSVDEKTVLPMGQGLVYVVRAGALVWTQPQPAGGALDTTKVPPLLQPFVSVAGCIDMAAFRHSQSAALASLYDALKLSDPET